ncbi:hypothetical protein M0811_12086 [Anaeramoeba ignava]|uniref:UDENN FLCN/SMCR8-type domain-containing protein n=1 Tax=Anaeramoeba ignava TaxID=1746090 RepID=A0A9Q0LAQ1_ANAIG|nr:hypothetical protein M0811_12086 [Anaeramoeba ignava]
MDGIVVLTEFSQKTGPVVRMVFPNDKEKPYLNNYAVLIMTTDYQTEFVGELISDTQFVISFSKGSMGDFSYSFVNHFTLLDIQARGFCRPFSLSFLSKNMIKIMENLDQMIRDFTTVSELLKLNSIGLFLKEIENYIFHLQKTNGNNQSRLNLEQAMKISSISEYMEDLEILKTKLIGSLSKSQSEKIQQISNQIKENSRKPLFDKDIKNFQNIADLNFDRELRPIEELCVKNIFEETKNMINLINSKYSQKNSDLILSQTLSTNENPKSSLLRLGGFPFLNFNPQSEEDGIKQVQNESITQTFNFHIKKNLNTKLLSEYLFFSEPLLSPIFKRTNQEMQVQIIEKEGDDPQPISPFLRFSENIESPNKLIREYKKNIANIIYVMLTGIPLIVRSEKQNVIAEFIKKIRCFIPGEINPKNEILWKTSLLKFQDLAEIKICGIPNSLDISPGIKPFVAHFDLDSRIFTPEFKLESQFINKMISNYPLDLKRKSVHLAYINSFLFEISVNAFVYYHFALSSYLNEDGFIDVVDQNDSSQRGFLDFFVERFKIEKHDLKILKYLSFIISKQQIEDFQANDKQNVHKIHLDFIAN